ncbi:hypothetical protein MCOR07_003619 [Pyricularia oryzae]|nr:hypothetical protein MCOR07_003619 [Pyricularia oryzae]
MGEHWKMSRKRTTVKFSVVIPDRNHEAIVSHLLAKRILFSIKAMAILGNPSAETPGTEAMMNHSFDASSSSSDKVQMCLPSPCLIAMEIRHTSANSIRLQKPMM